MKGKKKISELTDEEIYKYIYQEHIGETHCVEYQDREAYPKDSNIPAKNITYDNCRYCKKCDRFCNRCDMECYHDKSVIDYQKVRESIYKDDEIEVEDNEEIFN